MGPAPSVLLFLALAPFVVQAFLVACPDDAVPYCPDDRRDFDPCKNAQPCPNGQHCEKAPCSCSPTCKPDGLMTAMGLPATDGAYRTSCPPGKPFTQCFADPCLKHDCTPEQTCVSNTCGGCNYVCQDNHIQIPAALPNDACPDGKPYTNCLVDPCSLPNNCTGDNVVCQANYCGGCTSECLKLEVAKPISTGTSGKTCEPNKCKQDPCSTMKCTASTTCEADYCSCTGKCKKTQSNACLPSNCQFITDPCKDCTGKCTVDYCTCIPKCEQPEPKACDHNPCARVRCEPSYYKTTCVPDKETCDFKCMALPPPTCKAGYGYSSTLKACTKCKPGYVSSTGANVCAACEADFYESKNLECLPCPSGYTTSGKTGQSRCVKAKGAN